MIINSNRIITLPMAVAYFQLNAGPSLCFRATLLDPLRLTVGWNGGAEWSGSPACRVGVLFTLGGSQHFVAETSA